MSGEAKTSEFLLSTATLMIGPQAKVFELNPDDHSLGLVKNVQASSDMAYTELGQGINNQVVMSVNTKLDTKISSEVYEFTAKNLAYAAGVDGGDITENPDTYTLSADGTSGSALAFTSATGVVVGDWLAMQDTLQTDRIHILKVGTLSTNNVTPATGYAIPAGETWDKDTTIIYKVNAIDVGVNNFQPTFGAKLVGTMPGSGKPVTLIFPKVKITRGISLSFVTENFSNMPFELTPYQLTPQDPYFNEFRQKTWKIFRT